MGQGSGTHVRMEHRGGFKCVERVMHESTCVRKSSTAIIRTDLSALSVGQDITSTSASTTDSPPCKPTILVSLLVANFLGIMIFIGGFGFHFSHYTSLSPRGFGGFLSKVSPLWPRPAPRQPRPRPCNSPPALLLLAAPVVVLGVPQVLGTTTAPAPIDKAAELAETPPC